MSDISCEGHGFLYDGETRLAEGDYTIDGTLPELTGGVVRVEGYISTTTDLLPVFARARTPLLTLHLEGDLRWDCVLASVNGRLRNHSGFYRVTDGVRTSVPTLAALGLPTG